LEIARGRTMTRPDESASSFRMRDPGSLEVLERARELTVLTYHATSAFPAGERKGLASQMQRAAVSVGSNIAEGCGRSTTPSFLSFLQNAMGSLTELEYQATLALRLGIGEVAALHDVLSMTRRVKLMTTRLDQAVRKRRRS
jgi:four helix bundle protein